MPMNKIFTLNYLINSYKAGVAEVKLYSEYPAEDCEENILKNKHIEYEPSQRSIDAILNFASQYEVISSRNTGPVELNLN
jgi:tRNA U55 pseudouridine synthase TruB